MIEFNSQFEFILNFLIIETIGSTQYIVCYYNLYGKTSKAVKKSKTWL